MRVEYDTTPDDHEYFVRRAVDRYANQAQPRRTTTRAILWVIGLGLVAFILIRGGAIGSPLITIAFTIAFTIAIVSLVGHSLLPLLSARASQRMIREQVERLGPDFLADRFEVELLPEGFWWRHYDYQSLSGWNRVTAVSETKDYIEFFFDPQGMAVVAKRAFPDESAVREFIETAEAYRRAAGGGRRAGGGRHIAGTPTPLTRRGTPDPGLSGEDIRGHRTVVVADRSDPLPRGMSQDQAASTARAPSPGKPGAICLPLEFSPQRAFNRAIELSGRRPNV